MSVTNPPTVRRRCARCYTIFSRERGTRLKYCGDECRGIAARESNRLRNIAYRARRVVPVAV